MSGKIPMGADTEGAATSLVRVMLWGVTFAIGTLVVLFALLHIPSVQSVVVDFLIKKIEDRTGVKVMIAGYAWQPFSQLDLKALSIRAGDSRVLDCAQATVAYSFSPWQPFVHLEGLTLEKPVIHLERDARGRWQVRRPGLVYRGAPEAAPKERFPLDGISRFEVRIVEGTVLGQVNGQDVLAIRNMSGSLPFRMETGEDGPRIKVDLGQWQTGS